jgi:predicted naringenin-chalcone synthase
VVGMSLTTILGDLAKHEGHRNADLMFVLEEVVRTSDPQPGDWGVMTALGPGMAAEAALLRW